MNDDYKKHLSQGTESTVNPFIERDYTNGKVPTNPF